MTMPRDDSPGLMLEARITPDVLAAVEQAAAIEGRTVGEFVIAAAQAAASRTLAGTQLISLSTQDQQRFVDLLLDPRPITPAMQRAEQAHRTLIRSGDE